MLELSLTFSKLLFFWRFVKLFLSIDKRQLVPLIFFLILKVL